MILPDFLEKMIKMAENSDLSEFEPSIPVGDKDIVVREMRVFERVCFARIQLLKKDFAHLFEMGANPTSIGVRSIVLEIRTLEFMLDLSLKENNPENHNNILNFRKGWKLVKIGTINPVSDGFVIEVTKKTSSFWEKFRDLFRSYF